MDIKSLRKQVDDVDHEIMELISKRRDLVKLIGEYKKAHNLEIRDEGRWDEIVQDRTQKAQDHGLPEDTIERIWNILHELSLQVEEAA